MKKVLVVIVVCFSLMCGLLPVSATSVRGGTISVRPAYTPGIGVNIPKQTIIGTTKIYRRPIGGIYPIYGGVYYSGVRYSSKRDRRVSYEPQPQQQVVKEVYRTPPITSCSGLAFYDKDGNIIRCR